MMPTPWCRTPIKGGPSEPRFQTNPTKTLVSARDCNAATRRSFGPWRPLVEVADAVPHPFDEVPVSSIPWSLFPSSPKIRTTTSPSRALYRSPSPPVNPIGEFTISRRSRRYDFRLSWCTIEQMHAPPPATHGATVAQSSSHRQILPESPQSPNPR
jgi:hypothetical protein